MLTKEGPEVIVIGIMSVQTSDQDTPKASTSSSSNSVVPVLVRVPSVIEFPPYMLIEGGF